jgi:hypothetical protein
MLDEVPSLPEKTINFASVERRVLRAVQSVTVFASGDSINEHNLEPTALKLLGKKRKIEEDWHQVFWRYCKEICNVGIKLR